VASAICSASGSHCTWVSTKKNVPRSFSTALIAAVASHARLAAEHVDHIGQLLVVSGRRCRTTCVGFAAPHHQRRDHGGARAHHRLGAAATLTPRR
jgi:hypothetical protein